MMGIFGALAGLALFPYLGSNWGQPSKAELALKAAQADLDHEDRNHEHWTRCLAAVHRARERMIVLIETSVETASQSTKMDDNEKKKISDPESSTSAAASSEKPATALRSSLALMADVLMYEELLASCTTRRAELEPQIAALQATIDEEKAAKALEGSAARAMKNRPYGMPGANASPYIYLASSWKNPDVEAAVSAVRAAGYRCYDFKNPRYPEANGGGFGWSAIDPAWKAWTPQAYRAAMAHPVVQEGLRLDREALERAQATILFTPCGRSAHLEAGWAKGKGQLVIAVAREGFEVELMWGLFDAIVFSIEEAIELLDRGFPRAERFLLQAEIARSVEALSNENMDENENKK